MRKWGSSKDTGERERDVRRVSTQQRMTEESEETNWCGCVDGVAVGGEGRGEGERG